MEQISIPDSPVKAVVFDLGGVILRTDNPEPRQILAQRMGLTYLELDNLVFNNPISQQAERGAATLEQVWGQIGHALNLSDLEVTGFMQDFFAGDQIDDELIQLISELRKEYKTALLSNTWRQDLDIYVKDTLHIPDIFDIIISSAAKGIAKPDAGIFQLTIHALGVLPEETIFVDDNVSNIEAAARLGIRAIRFKNTTQCRNEILSHLKTTGSLSASNGPC